MLQGRFSLVNDIAALYVKVSKEFITPGIQKMQRLGVLKGEALRQGRNDFIDFCTDAEQQISELARQVSRASEPTNPSPLQPRNFA